MKYTAEIEVRFSDFDAYGHVNNAVYCTYLETARLKFLKEHALPSFSADSHPLFVVAKAECEYKKPINPADRVFVSISVSNIGNSSFTLLYNIHDNSNKLFAICKTIVVSLEQKEQKPSQLPKGFVSLLKKFT